MYDVSNNFKWNVSDYTVANNLLKYEGTPEAIEYFAQQCNKLTDYSYWYLLSTLWVSYCGHSDINLWEKLFSSNRPGKMRSIMKKSEYAIYENLPWFITVYRAHRKNEIDWISYTFDKETAFKFARQRNVNSIKEYEIKKRDITAVFLRRNESEIIVLDKTKAKFKKEHSLLT